MRIKWMIIAMLLCVLLSGCEYSQRGIKTTDATPTTHTVYAETEGDTLLSVHDQPTCSDVCEHQWSEATCAAPKTCTVCGETEGETLPHIDGKPVYSNVDVLTATAQYAVYCETCGKMLESGQDVAASFHDGNKFLFQDPWQWQERQLELGKKDEIQSVGNTTDEGEYVIQLYHNDSGMDLVVSRCVFFNGDEIVSEQDESTQFTAVRTYLGLNHSFLDVMYSGVWVYHAIAVMRTCDPSLTEDSALQIIQEMNADGVVSNGLSYEIYVEEEGDCLTLMVQVNGE